ncbi:hypothetical protein F899_00612 [Acinetobacter sp. CIP 101934]|uniref:hypothetical protein n=1 Tax=Acinetobacter sp. CIP 101934 TaxID=1144661 RepID=UPI0002CEF49C|nr:hypothetical protein [Acinetobacter sp. CIP 101934]ENX02974.1 hypothetical protein F899_00612 [Acinetobacter sp. CIP 101934]
MNIFKKIVMLPAGLVLGLVGCSSGSGKTYVLTTTSFGYDPRYRPYIVQVNGEEVGGGFGAATKRSAIITGPQYITWGQTNIRKQHVAKNVPYLTKEDLKGKSYLAVHLYPDDTVEITLTEGRNMPDATKKGLDVRSKLIDELNENDKKMKR